MKTYDVNLLLEAGSAAKTATGNGTGIAVNLRSFLACLCRVLVSACDAGNADETYVLNLQVSDALAGTYTTVATLTVVRGTTGAFEMAVTGDGVAKLDDDSLFARISWTLGGTTPSLTFKSFLAPAGI